MLRFLLGASVLAAALIPAAASAQGYYDSQGYWHDTARPAYDYGRDSAYRDYDRDDGQDLDDTDRADAYGQGYSDQQFTGRTGAAWRDDYGRYCRWREVTRRDQDGYQSYKWITVCR